MNDNRQEDTSPIPASENSQQVSAQRVIGILNNMDPKIIYMLYKQLAIDVKGQLEEKGMLPEVCPPEHKGRQSEHY